MVLGVAVTLGILTAGPEPVAAVPRGEQMSFPGGLTITNYVMPGGKRAYCIEISLGEPSGYMSEAGRVSVLPGRVGMFTAWGDDTTMRRMNYLIDQHGQNGDAWSAAAVQLTIWRMRENFTNSNPALNRTIATLSSSQPGRDLIKASDVLNSEARNKAVAPKTPKAVTGKLQVKPDPDGRERRYQVAAPAGTSKLSVQGGTFVRNGSSTLAVPGPGSATRNIIAKPGVTEITVGGTWSVQGSVGWGSKLDIYNTSTASGGIGQRLAVATGSSSGQKLNGRFGDRLVKVPPPWRDPQASSLAQTSAELGGTMQDTLIVSERGGSRARIWPNAVADFTAYLLPTVGSPKMNESWEPVLGDPVEVQAVDPDTGELLWEEQVDEAGDVQQVPVLEERREPTLWTAAELDAMSAAQRCLAQPVYREGGIPVKSVGQLRSKPVPVRSDGTVNWVERIVSNGSTVHEGTCGVANETTAIGRPGVRTEAVESVALGEELTDVAIVTGKFAPNSSYSLRFEAFRAEESAEGTPLCEVSNRVFRSEAISVSGPGKVRSPGFIARWEHGPKVWWVETLSLDTRTGPQLVQRGECGIESETSEIVRPSVTTLAPEAAVAGDRISDTARIEGPISTSDQTRWEISFEGYQASYVLSSPGQDTEPIEGSLVEGNLAEITLEDGSGITGKKDVANPVCTSENALFSTAAVPVTASGEVKSEEVLMEADWAGAVWWVETLWLVQGEERISVSRGECGIASETTVVSVPEISTQSSQIVTVGDTMSDVAFITGDISQREGISHEVVFEGYRGDAGISAEDTPTCDAGNALFTTPASKIAGAKEVVSPEVVALPEYGETVWWVAVLQYREGAAVTEIARGACGIPEETTTIASPDIRTESEGTVGVGQELFDTAIVSGPLPARDGLEYRVRFEAYAVGNDGKVVCTPESEIVELSDPVGVLVTGPGRYESRRVTTESQHIGVGGFVETLVMSEGGEERVVHVGECGAESERFEVVPTGETRVPPKAPSSGGDRGSPLPQTGAGAPLALGLLGGAVLLIGSTLLWAERRRKGVRRESETE